MNLVNRIAERRVLQLSLDESDARVLLGALLTLRGLVTASVATLERLEAALPDAGRTSLLAGASHLATKNGTEWAERLATIRRLEGHVAEFVGGTE